MTAKNTAPRARYATVEPTPLINEFCNWIERETGLKLSASERRAVYVGSALRATWQKETSAAKSKPQPAKPVKANPAARKTTTTTTKEAAK